MPESIDKSAKWGGFTEIYLEGTPAWIDKILHIAKTDFGNGCTHIDLKPEIKKEEEEQ